MPRDVATAIAICINIITMMKVFYNYAYLDVTKPGKFEYPGLSFCFCYEPFYIGKGFGRRWKKMCGRNRWLRNKLNKLGAPVDSLVSIFNEGHTESQVLCEEIELIGIIGRKDLGNGPLLNLTDGGETTVGMTPWNKGKSMKPWSVETREKMKHRVPWNKGTIGLHLQNFSEATRFKFKNRIPWNKGMTGGTQTAESNAKRSASVKKVRSEKFWSTRHVVT